MAQVQVLTSLAFGSLRAPRRLLVVALLAVVGAGCGPKVIRTAVFEDPTYNVGLRRTVEGDQPVARGYAHPAEIANVRVAHILASLSFQADGRRQPVIRSEHVYDLADHVTEAIQKATPDDEVVAAVFPSDRRLGLFSDPKVTAFRLYFQRDALVIEFFDIERDVTSSSGPAGREEAYTFPVEIPQGSVPFALAPGEGQVKDGARALRIAWRDPIYAKPVSLRMREGRTTRREVLMEASPGQLELPAGQPSATDPGLRDAQLRALDQLDALRRSGLIKEVDFRERRKLILEGRLEEAGYGPGAAPQPANPPTRPPDPPDPSVP
jgi:hypothetical protein